MARYKRRQLTDYLSTVILGSSPDDTQDGCRRAVHAALRYHQTSKQGNSQICLLGKYHNVLYVAATLCFDWNLDDTSVVEKLLQDIFDCEKTFEKLVAGAIIGTSATHFISGWKCDFNSRDECVRALMYFLKHASKANLSFDYSGEWKRFVDVPMLSYGRTTPLRLAVKTGCADVVALLLDYGAVISPSPLNVDTCAIQPLLHRMNDFCNERPGHSIPLEYVCCLNVLLKELPMMPRLLPILDDDDPQADPKDEDKAPEFNPRMYSFVPAELSGHMCRCVIRQELRSHGLLPHGVDQLLLPQSVIQFLNHEEDAVFVTAPCLRHMCRCMIRQELRSHGLLPHGVDQLLLPQSVIELLNHEEDAVFVTAPCLRHMCRCVIRQELRSRGLLPHGVDQLLLPQSVIRYLNHQEGSV